MASADIPLEEAIRLGLVPDETLDRLSRQGVLASPFLPGRLAARQMPFWRLPRLLRAPREGEQTGGRGPEVPAPGLRRAAPQRAVGLGRRRLEDEADFGLWDPRFGLGPLALGLSLSPPVPALRGGPPPVGRARGRGSQPPAPLEALLGRGDLSEIARRIEQGLLDPALLPPAVRAAVAPLLRAPGAGVVARSAPSAAPARPPATTTPEATPRPAPRPAQGGGALSRALAAARLARAVAGPFLTPQPSFAMPSATRTAFELQRASERTAGAEAPTPGEALDFSGGEPAFQGPSLGEALMDLELDDLAAEALRTGDPSRLPLGPDGQLTPEALQALARASARAGGGVPPSGGGPTETEPPFPSTWEPGMGPVAVPAAEIPSGAEAVETPTWELTPTGAEAVEVPEGTPTTPTPALTLPPAVSGGLGAFSAATQLAGGAQQIEQGQTAGGALKVAQGAAEMAKLAGLNIPYVGPVLALASIGTNLAAGGDAGERAAAEAGFQLATSAMLSAAGFGVPVFAIATIARDLINLGLGEYKQGDLSKRIMNAKQQFFAQYGNQAVTEAIRNAPDFAAAIRSLAAAPRGTSGQVQFGVGNEYAGMHRGVGQAGSTETPLWRNMLVGVSHPSTLVKHPDLVAGFIQNLWVQTGPTGAAAFNPEATRDYQVYLLSKLPNTPEWIAAKQMILSAEVVDPRDTNARDQAMARVPKLPVEPGVLRVNGLRIPTDHQYQWYDGAGGIWYDSSPERVAQTLMLLDSSTLFDRTTGQWMGAGGKPRTVVDEAYLDRAALATPELQAKFPPRRIQLAEPWVLQSDQTYEHRQTGEIRPATEPFLPPPVRTEMPAAAPTQAVPPPPSAESLALDEGRVLPSATEMLSVAPPPPSAESLALDEGRVVPPATTSATEMPSATPTPPAPGWVLTTSPVTGEPAWQTPEGSVWPMGFVPAQAPPAPPVQDYPGMQTGGVAPYTGTYRLHAGENVLPPRLAAVLALRRHGLARRPAGPPPSLQQGGQVPQTGLYRLHEGEEVIPASHEQSETTQDDQGRWINVYGRATPQAGQPLPPVHPFEREAYESREEAEDAARRRSRETDEESVPEGRWFLHPKRGVPFEAKSNPEPGRVWRLAFNAEQLYEAWEKRGKEGWPLLVPPSVTERRDWPQMVERARRTQYQGVHPAVLLARAVPPDETGFEGAPWPEALVPGSPTNEEMHRRERTPPMREMPPSRPMSPDEQRGIVWPATPS